MATDLNITNIPAPYCGDILKKIFKEAAHFAGRTFRKVGDSEESE